MPPGVLPPQIMRMDAGSVPIGYLVLASKKRVAGHWPTWPNSASVRWCRPTCRAPWAPRLRHQHPLDRHQGRPRQLAVLQPDPGGHGQGLVAGNVIRPPATCTSTIRCRWCPPTRWSRTFRRSATFPSSRAETSTSATWPPSPTPQTSIRLRHGQRPGSVYIPVVKKNTASTLKVVADIHQAMPTFKNVLPEGVDISYEFDESPTVCAAIRAWAPRGDRRRADRADDSAVPARLAQLIVVVFNIPHGSAGLVAGAVDHGRHDQHHDAGRPGPVDRHAGG